MASIVTLKVRVDDNEFQTLKKNVAAFEQKEIRLKITGTESLRELTTALKQYSQSQIDAANALTKAKQAEVDLLNARTKLMNATTLSQRKKQEEINLEKKATLEKEKQATAERKLSAEKEKTAQTANKLSTAQERTAQTANRLAIEQERTARSLDRTKTSAKALGDVWQRMFSQFSLANMASTAATRAIAAMRTYFREALNEMKELDTALTHYRQVTGASAGTAAELGSEAYSVGSQYGTKASDYAESLATYARAGYKETADQLAELSMKTVIVGQTTQEIADQFLLTMDAAYKYGGSVEQLSKVLDGASKIDSTYATTIEKIAAGLGIVAPVAQQMHVTEKELTAAVGTITAVTQRSGAEAARALRSLFLNIMKDTTTEIEDGVTATEESVADMQTLLNRYARDAVQAAEATGTIINPMEAIGALAGAMEEGLLSEAELMEKMSSLGGKLRVSQLVALVSNWKMYNDMIATYEDSMGSADVKTNIYLESWEAKTNILKNTWTEFVAKSLNTDTIKGFITGLTNVLKVIGNLGNAIKIIVATVATVKIAKRISELNTLKNALNQSSAALRTQAAAYEEEAVEAGIARNAEAANAATTQAGIATKKADEAATKAQAAAHKMLALTIGTIAVSAIMIAIQAYNSYHQKRMQQLEEERDAAIESAKVQQDKANEVYEAFEAYNSIKESLKEGTASTEEYEQAVYNLATALGVQKTSLAENEAALLSLAKSQEYVSERATEDALQIAKMSAASALKYNELWRELDGTPTQNTPEYRWYQQWGVVPKNEKSYIVPMAELEQSKDIDESVRLYKGLLKIQDEYLQKSKGNTEQAKAYGESYDDLTKALSGYAKWLDPIIEQEELLEKYRDQKISISAEAENFESLSDIREALEISGKLADAATKSFGGLAEAIGKAKKELEAYKKQTQTEKDDDYTAYADAWKKAYEDIQKGMKNSNAVNAALDLFFTPEQIMKMHERGVEAADIIASDFWKEIFTYTDEKGELQFINDDAGANFIWALKDKYADAAGEIRNQNGDLVASFQEVDGELSVQVDDFDALSRALSELPDGIDIDPNMLAAIFEALNMYTPTMQYTAENLMELAKGLNAVSIEGNIDLEKLIQGEIDAGKPTEEIADLYENVVKLADAGEVEINVEKGDNLEDVKTRVEELIKNRDELSKEDADIKVKADTKEASADLDRIIVKEKQVKDNSPVITVSLEDLASRKLDDLNNKAKDKTVTYTVKTVHYTVNTPDNGKNEVRLYASGTQNAKGGLSLVNEHGAEIIQEGDSARIAGNGKPTLTWIQSGATIFNAKETRAILGGMGASALYDGINSYAGDGATGIPRYQPKDAAPKTDGDGGTPSYTPTSSPKTDTKKETEKNNEKDEELERLKKIVELRESELKLLEARKRPASEQIKKQEQIKKAIQDQIDYLKKKGGQEKEINDLKVKQLKIDEDIKELEKGRMEKAIKFRESELKLLEAQDASVKSQIQKQRQIYKIYGSLIKYLKAHGASQTEINELLEKQKGIQEDIKKLNEELYDDLEKSIKNEVDKINEKRDKELEKLDKKIEKLQQTNEEEQKATELQDKQLAIEKAREKLANARAERTIRFYNAKTRQSEWRADAQQVENAKKELEDAKKALSDYKAEKKLDKRIENLEKQKEEVTQKYLEKTDQWQKILDSMAEPVASISKTLKKIENNATKDQKSTLDALNKLLKPLGYKINTSKLYDSGGILSGTGGIKGTSKDEVILPPDIASKMLKPISTATLNSRLNELRYLYGTTGANAAGITSNSSIGSQYNGNLYTFGNITLTEGQARSTTIYDLVQRSRGLRAYSGGM